MKFMTYSQKRVSVWLTLILVLNITSFTSTFAETADSLEKAKEAPYEREYRRILRRERASIDRTDALEGFISGVGATIIGTYGIYNDDRGILTRVLYSATQTAGIIAASNYLLMMRSPSSILNTDDFLRKNFSMDRAAYQRLLVRSEQQRARAVASQITYSGLVLAIINGYNGYREKNAGLRNVFYFLSFNFALVSTISFAQQHSVSASEVLSYDIGFNGKDFALGLNWRH